MAGEAFHLVVHADEVPTLRLALTAFRDDFGHNERQIVRLAGSVLDSLDDAGGTVALSEGELKVTVSALHTLLDDSRRDEQAGRAYLHTLLGRLPSIHDVRAIDLDRLTD